jgi:uncharacterized protein YkwD
VIPFGSTRLGRDTEDSYNAMNRIHCYLRFVPAAMVFWASLAQSGCAGSGQRSSRVTRAALEAGNKSLDPLPTVTEIIEAHNRARLRSGRSLMQVSPSLTVAAQAHADDMAARRRMSHKGSDGSSPFGRIDRLGYQYDSAAENVAAGQRSLDQVMTDWMKSPGHRRNILGRYTEVGAGYATDEAGTCYWCVTFATPRDG